MSNLTDFFSGGDAGFKLAPDIGGLDSNNDPLGYKSVTINASSGLTTALSLTGKFAISSMFFSFISQGAYVIKLTIDGVVIYNDNVDNYFDYINILGMYRHGGSSGFEAASTYLPTICESSLLLEIDSSATGDTSFYLNYSARPIL